jgi:hypothetical protein
MCACAQSAARGVAALYQAVCRHEPLTQPMRLRATTDFILSELEFYVGHVPS